MMNSMRTPAQRASASDHRGLTWIALSALMLSACAVAPVAPRDPPPIFASQGPAGAVSTGAPASSMPTSTAPVYFYPERAQRDEQQDRDRYECYRWAVRESGFDPGMTTVRQPLPPPRPVSGEALRDGSGVLAGAATGAVIGAAVSSPRQAGVNAVIGAIFGAALGASAQESRAQATLHSQARHQQAAGAAVQAARGPLDNFRRAMSACMQGRGYRVS